MIKSYVKYFAFAALLIILLGVWFALKSEGLSLYATIRFSLIIVFGYVATLFDISQKRIPNGLVLGMFAAWALLIFLLLVFRSAEGVEALIDSVLGLFTGGGVFLVVYILSKKGLGGGDVKFMAAAGLYLGLSKTIPAILYGTILAALVGFIFVALGKITKKDSIPLAPFLFIGIAITAFT